MEWSGLEMASHLFDRRGSQVRERWTICPRRHEAVLGPCAWGCLSYCTSFPKTANRTVSTWVQRWTLSPYWGQMGSLFFPWSGAMTLSMRSSSQAPYERVKGWWAFCWCRLRRGQWHDCGTESWTLTCHLVGDCMLDHNKAPHWRVLVYSLRTEH